MNVFQGQYILSRKKLKANLSLEAEGLNSCEKLFIFYVPTYILSNTYQISSTNVFMISGMKIGVFVFDSSMCDRIDLGVLKISLLLFVAAHFAMFCLMISSLSGETYDRPKSGKTVQI